MFPYYWNDEFPTFSLFTSRPNMQCTNMHKTDKKVFLQFLHCMKNGWVCSMSQKKVPSLVCFQLTWMKNHVPMPIPECLRGVEAHQDNFHAFSYTKSCQNTSPAKPRVSNLQFILILGIYSNTFSGNLVTLFLASMSHAWRSKSNLPCVSSMPGYLTYR